MALTTFPALSDLPALLDDLHGFVRGQVAAGFAPPDAIIDAAVDAFGDEADAAVVRLHARRFVAEVITDHMAEQVSWPAVTDCDRLDAAFAQLEAGGIVCRQDFTCCGTCGASEIWDEIADAREAGHEVRGYAFYHRQDTESAAEGYGLYLSYGAVASGEEAAQAVARAVIAALEHQGLRTEWSGAWSQRISVALDWKRRRAA